MKTNKRPAEPYNGSTLAGIARSAVQREQEAYVRGYDDGYEDGGRHDPRMDAAVYFIFGVCGGIVGYVVGLVTSHWFWN